MSLSSSRRAALAALACLAIVLSGCTLAPLHGGGSTVVSEPLPLAYGASSSRLQQVFYQTVAAKLGTATASDARRLIADVSMTSSAIGLSSRSSPVTDRQVIATITWRVEKNGTSVASGTRKASAAYRTTGQIVADDAARQNADEEAVRSAAQSVIAALLSEPSLR